PCYENFYWQGSSDGNGHLVFPSLESGKEYGYTITAPNHESASGVIAIGSGSGVQIEDIALIGLPGLVVQPEALTFSATRGQTKQHQLVLSNQGAAPVTIQSIAGPASLPWVYLGQPPEGTVLAPGEERPVLVNASPTLSEMADNYASEITITGSGGVSVVAPVNIQLNDGITRTLQIQVLTEGDYQALPNATVVLENQTGLIVSDGVVTETLDQVIVEQTDANGYVAFDNLIPGPYLATVGMGDDYLGKKEIEVVPGDNVQQEVIVVEEGGLITTFSVTPGVISDTYTTVMTMTFIPYATPRVTLYPREVNLCNAPTEGITETITVHNFYNVAFSDTQIQMETYGNVMARLTTLDGSQSVEFNPVTDSSPPLPLNLGTLPPLTDSVKLLLNARLINGTCAEHSQGGVNLHATGEWVHAQPQSWYGSAPFHTPSPLQPDGLPRDIPLVLSNLGYPTEANLHTDPPTLEDITLTPPQVLPWMGIDTTHIASLPVGSDFTFNLVVTPTLWLAPGLYYDHILIQATNGITGLIGIEAEMTDEGLHVETQLITPLYVSAEGSAAADGNAVVNHSRPPGLASINNFIPPGQGNGGDLLDQVWAELADLYNDSPTVTLLDENWALDVGCQCGGDPVVWTVVGNKLVRRGGSGGGSSSSTPTYASDFKENVVILRLEQRYSFEREAFFAQLDLDNGSLSELSDFSIDLIITNISGNQVMQRLPGDVLTPTTPFEPALPMTNTLVPTETLVSQMPGYWAETPPVNFIIIPEEVDAPNLGPSGSGTDSHTINWTIVPDAFGLEDPTGEQFFVSAVINYNKNGVPQDPIVTTEEPIWVHPQPRLMLDYFVPDYVYGGETFDWVVVVTNLGYGTARNFRIETPQPVIVQQSEMYPTDFTLVGESVIHVGDIGPGEQFIDAWRIIPSNPGTFVDWEATCVHENYMGVELPPLMNCVPNIHVLHVEPPVSESQQWGKENSCLVGSYQGFDSDPVNTFSGNFTYNTLDVNIPTWGEPLQFERSYNSRDDEDGPLGPGWTHNYNMNLVRQTFVPLGDVEPLDYMIVRMPRGSRAYFEIGDDGTTFTPLPGVRASLVWDSIAQEYTLTQPNDLTKYIFHANQYLLAIEDANGNRITFDYVSETVNNITNYYLNAATGPAGRQLTFAYNNDWHMTSMTDPLGRVYTYSYTDGYLTGATDFRGQATQYTYTPPNEDTPGQLVSIVDANGHAEVTNSYNNERRVYQQTDALGNVTTFSYLTDTFAGTRATVITDPNGNETTDVYDADGRIIERRDAHGFFESYSYNADNNLTQLVDKNGHATSYEWNAYGCDVARVTDPLGNVTVMTHDDNNNVTSIQDERGYVTTMVYDAYSNPTATTDPLGGVVTRAYGSHGELLSETNENGEITWYGYDAYGHTIVISDALDNVTTMTYDLAGRLFSSADALGRATTYDYDPEDNLLSVNAPLSATTTFAYDNVGNLLNTTDALGRATTYTYDARNRQTLATDPLGNTQSFVYDAVGNMTAATDENGNATTYQYDGLNRVTAVTNPLSGSFQTSYDPVGNILSETDANGNVTHYVYDDNDRRVDTVYADGSVMQAEYDAADNMTALTDAEGRTVTYAYDAMGRTATKSDPTTIGANGGVTTYGYDAVGNQISMIDAEGRITGYEYDALNRLSQVANPISGTTGIGYDAVGNRISLTDANGRIAAFVYDDLNRLIATTDPLSGTTTFAYNAVGNQTAVTDPLGRATTTVYDALNRPTAITNALGGTVAFTYDDAGNLLTETDEEGRVTTYAYDAVYRTVAIVNALDYTTALAYDANGNLIGETDPEGRTAVYEYDNLNQLIRVTDPLSGTISYAYDNVGNRIGVTNANGNSVAYQFDGLDRMVSASDALGNATTYAYDKVGNLLTLTDAEGNSAVYEYDDLDRAIAITDALGGQTTTTYDAVGNVLTAADAEGRTTAFVYDALDRPVQATDPLGHSATYAYDAVGNQTAVTDTIGRVTTFAYDDLNRLTAAADPLGQTTVFTYSLAGDLLSEQNPLGQVTAYHYDALGRLTQAIDPLAQTMTTTYDAVGNPISVTDAAGRTTQFAYDDLNRLVQATDPLDGTTSYAYDAVGNQTGLTNANNQTIAYAYDAANRLTAVADPLSQITTFAYDAVGNQISLTDPLSRTTAYDYDALYRLTTLTDAADNGTQYVYDAVGNQTGVTDAEGRATTIAYDALNRPIAATNPLSGTTQFVYDEAGRLVNEIDAAGRVVTYTYDALDRLATAVDPLGNVTTNQYDALGNLTNLTDALNRTANYQYDALNRLVQVTNPLSGTTQFAYDPVGNLAQQLDPLGTAVSYQYDALDRVITETNALGGTTVYAYDAIGNLTAVADANDHTAQMTYDALNRLQTVTDPLGEVTSYSYDAVGNNTAILDPLGQTTQFNYDALDRLIAAADPLSRTTTYAYDRVSNQIGLTDAEGVTTRYAYDALNRLAQVTENHVPGGQADEQTNVATQFAYDAVGNLTAMSNPLGNSFTFAYDALNRLASSADPLGNGGSYSYDAAGNLTQVVDANGATTTYAYDALNRLNGITRPDEIVGFTYDAAGNRLTMSDPAGMTAYGYDALYRLTQVTDPLSQTVQYGYDAVGNRASLVYPGGETATYTYDAANRLQTAADWDVGITQYDYDAVGRLVQMILPNDIASGYSYDAAGQLTDIQHTHPVSGPLASYAYGYDQVGNRVQASEMVLLPGDIVPTAVFTAAPRGGAAPLIVTFFNDSANADEYVWDFGDGITLTTTSMEPISHTYTTTGLFTVSLTAVNEKYSHSLTRENYISIVPAGTFLEVDGLLVLEAENAHAVIPRGDQSWLTATALNGYAGATYLQARPDMGALYAADYMTTSPELQFQVNFVNPGTYTVWARGAATDAGGDSIHIGLDGAANAGSEALTGFRFNQWDWSAGTMSGAAATIEIAEPGVYAINVWAREDGVRLDRILLSSDPAFAPVGAGPAESPRAGEAQAALFVTPHSTATTALTLNDSYVQAAARRQQMAQLWANLLANPGSLAMAPLALIAPFSYDRRRRKKSQIATAVILALVILGVGFALASGGGLGAAEGNQWSVFSNQLSVNGSLSSDNRLLNSNYALQMGGATVIDYEYDPLYRLTGAVYDTGQSFGYAYDAAGNRLTASMDGSP
ncbi:MAG: PKD domain-containing protein, partial [Chloroflexi bacterium]|nr:PKD domain-containing protein [Chloroflexota bacterium]